VNTFLNEEYDASLEAAGAELIRSSEDEKQAQVKNVRSQHAFFGEKNVNSLKHLQDIAAQGNNVFEELMESAKTCTLGQISNALYQVGGQYRRNM